MALGSKFLQFRLYFGFFTKILFLSPLLISAIAMMTWYDHNVHWTNNITWHGIVFLIKFLKILSHFFYRFGRYPEETEETNPEFQR